MANIAQIANVLQSVVLTEGSRMLLTPTYHVFDLYKGHQSGTLIDSFIETKHIGDGENCIPNLNESVSMGCDGNITSTLCNLSATDDYDIELMVFDKVIKSARTTILQNKIDAFNTFDNPSVVNTEEFNDMLIKDEKLHFRIPACSVLSINLL